MNELHLFDLDYTLFKTDAKVALYTNGEFERWFRGAKEYHAHQKIANDSHVYDFSQYISSHDFRQQATRQFGSLIKPLKQSMIQIAV